MTKCVFTILAEKNVTQFDIVFSCNHCKILFNEKWLLLKLRHIHCKDMTSFECLLYLSKYYSHTCTFIYLLNSILPCTIDYTTFAVSGKVERS